MFKYFWAFIIPFLMVIVLMPALMRFAEKIQFIDKPTERKKHKNPVPLIGGVAMFIGFFTGFLYNVAIGRIELETIIIFIASLMVLIIGLVDDFYKTRKKEFPIYPRFIVQILAAILVYKSGVVFMGFTNPFGGNFIMIPEILQFILTITWIFGVTTVINWSDGMDGLAGGLSAISATTMFVVAMAKEQSSSAVMSICLVGAILGFLNFNRHPARVFMGDSGANFLGFILSIIALDGAFKQATVMSMLIPIFALGVPIFDNIFVIFKRFIDGKPVYQADRSQIHFRLEERGMTPKQVVTYICLISGGLSLISIIILVLKL
ncbi:UDP-N-acetylmuramyl pentapeptide phosphotransferase/UDP-N-acetylglucosamine-1-phosphate transferase [Clostridium cavendishii DSM 21758]|uniref:UDP-N-acetylmuramyl pentapeptide phosphotransferase/UDP-N-acetylglucosamine-1-phosphate transferase n=1 Tax=Clostridium cavendishii DSM 21758 TaxID=1121302 RepID=A0A1M6ENV4_9CLOT|nr:MraY family glycosyltransferase [Clostridium cavendishii]SHI87038.1 UDP-N-acetylmuramyl pentapeptide phosphotransferase/UDP-N-acetylglucosamine-1-phosphate transferase [Clostridium cavendishii DSM 21758]